MPPEAASLRDVTIRRWSEVADRGALTRDVDAIFFEASNTKSFDSQRERDAFRERWLGRFLAQDPDLAFLAFADGTVVGYIVGSLDDPARSPRFADLPYFAGFAELTRMFPAQLHVNLAPAHRGRGIGRRLIEAFVAEVRRAGVSGVHVITTRAALNLPYYERVGFQEAGAMPWNGRELIFLGRAL